MDEIKITHDLRQKIQKNYNTLQKKLEPYSEESKFSSYIDSLLQINELRRFDKFFTKPKKDRKYLEIGSGFGFNLVNSLNDGYDIIGVEPGKSVGFEERFDIAMELMKTNNIMHADKKLIDTVGENLNYFKDETFDMVFNIAVLEHVNSIKKTLLESKRVLKVDGIMYMNIPNYNSFYEAHYNILWIPYILLYKPFARLYLRLRGRDDFFVNELNFTTPSNINKILKNCSTEDQYYILPHFDGLLSKLGHYYYLLATGMPTENKMINFIKKKTLLRKVIFLILSIIVKVFTAIGMVSIFNVIYVKGKVKLENLLNV